MESVFYRTFLQMKNKLPTFGVEELSARITDVLRWPNTVFARAFADAIRRARKDCKKTNMPSIDRFHCDPIKK